MTCTQSDTLIQRSLDGRLTPNERTSLDAHLARCPACRAAWDGYRQLTQTATDWTRHPIVADDPGDAFTAQVLARIDNRPAPTVSVPAGRFALIFALSVLALTALSIWAGPLLLVPLPSFTLSAGHISSVNETSQWLGHLPQDTLAAWTTLTARTAVAPAWLWSVLAATLALNGAFVWRTRLPERAETAR